MLCVQSGCKCSHQGLVIPVKEYRGSDPCALLRTGSRVFQVLPHLGLLAALAWLCSGLQSSGLTLLCSPPLLPFLLLSSESQNSARHVVGTGSGYTLDLWNQNIHLPHLPQRWEQLS
jgi:hypothetical protein